MRKQKASLFLLLKKELKEIQKKYKIYIYDTRQGRKKIHLYKGSLSNEAWPSLPPLEYNDCVAWIKHVYTQLKQYKGIHIDSLICSLIHKKRIEKDKRGTNKLTPIPVRFEKAKKNAHMYNYESLINNAKRKNRQFESSLKINKKVKKSKTHKSGKTKKAKMSEPFCCKICTEQNQHLTPYSSASGLWYHMKRTHGAPTRPYNSKKRRREKELPTKQRRRPNELTIQIPNTPQTGLKSLPKENTLMGGQNKGKITVFSQHFFPIETTREHQKNNQSATSHPQKKTKHNKVTALTNVPTVLDTSNQKSQKTTSQNSRFNIDTSFMEWSKRLMH
jgi:hypothetical protein